MTAAALPTGSVPRHALRRGTRGVAAVVLFLTSMIAFGVVGFVLPASGIDGLALSWLIPLGLAFAIAHLVATYGIIRRRGWVTPLTLYLAAIGIGVAVFVLLLVRAGVLGASAPEVAGLVVWLIGSWLVAARFVLKGMAPPVLRPVEPVAPRTEPVNVPAFGVPGRAGTVGMALLGGSAGR